jgi:hypothetical protein
MGTSTYGAMQPDVYQGIAVEVDTDMGIFIIPTHYLLDPLKSTELGIMIKEAAEEYEATESLEGEKCQHIWSYLHLYCDFPSEMWSVPTLQEGWLARLSMPGYLDQTDWTIHEDEESAYAYLEETYGDDEQ